MSQFDYGSGCACGLYRECECNMDNQEVEEIIQKKIRYSVAESAKPPADNVGQALKDANDICRSMYQIALREQANSSTTNWKGFIARLEESLKQQHIAMLKAGLI